MLQAARVAIKIHPPGTMIDGTYEVLSEPIGVGGFGAVYRVRHRHTNQVQALKILHEHLVVDEKAVESFEREMKLPATFSNARDRFGLVPRDRVVQVAHAVIDRSLGPPYMVMDLLQGEGLDQRIARLGRLPSEMTLRFMKDLACALDEAHTGNNPIVHRDLKPENLYIVTSGTAEMLKVLDFGIAKPADSTGNQTLDVVGTPQFMAPEQWDPRGVIDRRTDLWALGLIVFTTLVGGVFWDAQYHHQLVPLVLHLPIPSATERARALGVELPPAFDEWFKRCVARDPAARFEHAGDAVTALETALGAWPGAASMDSPVPCSPSGVAASAVPPGVGLDEHLATRGHLPARDARALLVHLATEIEDMRGTRDAPLLLTPGRVRLPSKGSGAQVAVWEAFPPEVTAAEQRGTRTLVSRFGVDDFAYVAPETLRHGKGSAAADVWSLAMLTFEVLSGVRFWPQVSIPKLLQAVEAEPLPLPSKRIAAVKGTPALPTGFDGWFERSTQHDPAKRWQTPARAVLEFAKLFSPRERPSSKVLATVIASTLLVSGAAVWLLKPPIPPSPVDAGPRLDVVEVPPDASSAACEALEGRGNPFVYVTGVGCVQQHEVSEREFAGWRDAGNSSSMPQRDVDWEQANQYCADLHATLPPPRLWNLLLLRAPELVTGEHRVLFPQGDSGVPLPVDRAQNGDDFDGVLDLVGNLAEWTCGQPLSTGQRVARGAHFYSRGLESESRVRDGEPVFNLPSPVRGFRCAVVRECE